MQELVKAQARKAFDGIKGELVAVGVFLAAVWLVFLMDSFLPLTEWLSLVPRQAARVAGNCCHAVPAQ